MKNQQGCPKCSSKKIQKIPAYKTTMDGSNRCVIIPISWKDRRRIVPTSYLCHGCGYIESYIESKEELSLIEKYKLKLKSFL